MNAKLLFLGDLYYDYEYVAEDIMDISKWINDNDYHTILNLEGCIDCGRGTPIEKRGPNRKSNSNILEILKSLNVIGVCLSNNHIMDYGEELLQSTCHVLKEKGILYVGAGKDLDEALAPMRLQSPFDDVIILNYGWNVEETIYATNNAAGCAPRDEHIILEQIELAKKNASKVIVCMHWGFEHNRLPMPYDIDLAHKMVDAGANLIIGHHPHCVQAKEVYKGVRIYYSLGNFYFASERKNFNAKYKEPIVNQADFGLAVCLDLSTGEFEEYLVEYVVDKDRSTIGYKQGVLEDITGVDYCSDAYLRQVKNRKRNINPVLTCNDVKDEKRLQRLFRYYAFKARVKKILRK